MFEFREINYHKDLNEITNLIRDNLDFGYTKEFFKWKHLENPFGVSYGLLALYQGRIIGLRMFMFWEFNNTEQAGVLRAIRPVDTVVDRSFRGKGLFRKLTLEGLKNCENQYDLIFNTPNKNSLPGYLKMGWDNIHNSRNFKIGLINPVKGYKGIEHINLDDINKDISATGYVKYNTNKTTEFLNWRYSLKHYNFVKYRDSYAIYSTSRTAGFKSLIIHEIMGNPLNFDLLIHSLGLSSKAFLIYYYDGPAFRGVSFIKSIFRQRAVIVSKEDKKNISGKIDFSLGDLEGKL